ncbi:HipA domain-containing protein [Ammonicoccus fulvus]|uniref:HipA domain-containing protein n=1 Tax=Ammonicoccus fulvus TaxID=3138240 RepID=A0ABZ3FRD1_9ACTN
MKTLGLLHVVIGNRQVGTLNRSGRTLSLTYSADARNDTDAVPLSTRFPLSVRRHKGTDLENWLRCILPERPELLAAWRRRLGLTDLSLFTLLTHVGEEVAGAAQFVRPDRLDEVLSHPGGLTNVDSDQIADLLRQAQLDIPSYDEQARLGHFSLAGMQPKIALQRRDEQWWLPAGREPSTHILKALSESVPDSDVVEALTTRIAGRLGLPTARVTLGQFGSQRATVVERFDRRWNADHRHWVRIHQEDMCQALGLAHKYQSEGGPAPHEVADLLRRVSAEPETDVRAFARLLIFNTLTLGTDAHARNYSLLLSPSGVRLAPAYDLNSLLAVLAAPRPEIQLSMSVGRRYHAAAITQRDWEDCATYLGIPAQWILTERDRQRDLLVTAFERSMEDQDLRSINSPAFDRMRAGLNRAS